MAPLVEGRKAVSRVETGWRAFLHRRERDLLDLLARRAAGWAPDRRRRASRLVAALARDLLRLRWSHVVTTLQARLGLDEAAARALGRRVYDAFFENALEQATLAYLPGEEIDARVAVEGLERLQKAHARGKGVVLVSGHYGLWEFVTAWLVRHGYRMTAVMRRQNNVAIDAWMESMRRTHGVEITDSGYALRDILRTLRQGHLLGLVSDQDAGDKGIFVRFFGELASTVSGPASIALKMGAPLMAVACNCRAAPPFEICEPWYPEDFSDDEAGRQALTQAFTTQLETWIRARPEQWFWLHRRWKTRPPPGPGRPAA